MLLEEIIPAIRIIVRDNAELVGILGLLIGTLIGNWLAIGRDQRREFNETCVPLRKWLLREVQNPSPDGGRPTDIEVDLFAHKLPRWKRRGFTRAYNQQAAERQKISRRSPKMGQAHYADTTRLKALLKKCLAYTKPR